MLFGLLQADPAETLGYERIDIPGVFVGDFLGSGSYSDVFEATVSEVNVLSNALQQEVEVALPNNFAASSTPWLTSYR